MEAIKGLLNAVDFKIGKHGCEGAFGYRMILGHFATKLGLATTV